MQFELNKQLTTCLMPVSPGQLLPCHHRNSCPACNDDMRVAECSTCAGDMVVKSRSHAGRETGPTSCVAAAECTSVKERLQICCKLATCVANGAQSKAPTFAQPSLLPGSSTLTC